MRHALVTTTVAALVAATIALAGAATAAAGSLVYVKDHNVWLASDDGTGAYQVTADGTAANPWQSPSQADDGTIVAARKLPRSGPLVRMRQNGTVINEITLAPMQFGPFDPAVSPDGATVAYSHGFSRYVNGYLETGTDIRYARTDGPTDPAAYPAVSTGATTPSWIDAGRIFVARGTVAFTQTPGLAANQWWSDYDHYDHFGGGADLSDGEVAGSRVALVRANAGHSTIQLYSTAGGAPTPTCTVSDPADGPNGRHYADPTLTADGRRLFWQEGDGVWAATMPADGSCTGWTVDRLIEGASEPDWGPAAARPEPRPQTPAPAPSPGTPSPAPVATPPVGTPPVATPPAANPQKPATCAQRSGAAREACVYAAAVKACAKQPKRRRAACRTAAKRVRAASVCKRTKRGAAQRTCLRKAARLR